MDASPRREFRRVYGILISMWGRECFCGWGLFVRLFMVSSPAMIPSLSHLAFREPIIPRGVVNRFACENISGYFDFQAACLTLYVFSFKVSESRVKKPIVQCPDFDSECSLV